MFITCSLQSINIQLRTTVINMNVVYKALSLCIKTVQLSTFHPHIPLTKLLRPKSCCFPVSAPWTFAPNSTPAIRGSNTKLSERSPWRRHFWGNPSPPDCFTKNNRGSRWDLALHFKLGPNGWKRDQRLWAFRKFMETFPLQRTLIILESWGNKDLLYSVVANLGGCHYTHGVSQQ